MDFRGRRIFFNIVGSVLTLLVCAGIFFSIVNVVFNLCFIKTNVYQISMYPTLNANVKNLNERGDVVYINKYAPVENGNIVVARVEWNEKPIIKRLIAGPNDSFRIEKNADESFSLFVNEKLFYTMPQTLIYNIGQQTEHSTENHYIAFCNYVEMNSANSQRILVNSQGKKSVRLFKDEYLLMGDNWAESKDGLTMLLEGYPFVCKKEIIGKVDIVIHKGQNKYLTLFKQMMQMVFSF